MVEYIKYDAHCRYVIFRQLESWSLLNRSVRRSPGVEGINRGTRCCRAVVCSGVWHCACIHRTEAAVGLPCSGKSSSPPLIKRESFLRDCETFLSVNNNLTSVVVFETSNAFRCFNSVHAHYTFSLATSDIHRV